VGDPYIQWRESGLCQVRQWGFLRKTHWERDLENKIGQRMVFERET
jgi:hypothetical protein